MSNYDWSRFTVRINVNAPVEKLYRAWATRPGMEHWFLRLSEYIQPDGSAIANDEFAAKGTLTNGYGMAGLMKWLNRVRYWIVTGRISSNSALEKRVTVL